MLVQFQPLPFLFFFYFLIFMSFGFLGLCLIFIGTLAGCVVVSNISYLILGVLCAFIQVFVFLLCLNTEFLAITFLIIYVGAMAILFVFSMMVIRVKSCSYPIFSFKRLFTFVSLSFLGVSFILDISSIYKSFSIFNLYVWDKAWISVADTEIIFSTIFDVVLFSEFMYEIDQELFILCAVLLCIALCGVLVLALPSAVLRHSKAI